MAKRYVLRVTKENGESKKVSGTSGIFLTLYDLFRDGVLVGDKPTATVEQRRSADKARPEIVFLLGSLKDKGYSHIYIWTETDLAEGGARQSPSGSVTVDAALEFARAYSVGGAQSHSNPMNWSKKKTATSEPPENPIKTLSFSDSLVGNDLLKLEFARFLRKYAFFYGQEPIINQLEILGNEIKEGNNLNIILAAQSGYGKTTLAERFTQWVLSEDIDQAVVYTGDLRRIVPDKKFHILDEAHLIRKPEFLYPLMDSKEHTFIITTNEYYSLKEPFYNRCHEFIFTEYSYKDLCKICYSTFEQNEIEPFIWLVEKVVTELGRGVPRVLVTVTERLCYYFKQSSKLLSDYTVSDITELFKTLMDTKDGLSRSDQNYLLFLRKVGGRASLTLIANSIKMPKEVITNMIEPYLIGRGLVEIRNGRQLTALGMRYIF